VAVGVKEIARLFSINPFFEHSYLRSYCFSLRKMILQFFLEDRNNPDARPKPVIVKASDKLWNVVNAGGYDRARYSIRLFDEKDRELSDFSQLCSTLPVNSTIRYEATPLYKVEDTQIPCDVCGRSFPVAGYASHGCTNPGGRSAPSRNNTAGSGQSGGGGGSSEMIPCERCAKMVPFSTYDDHAATCGLNDN